MIGQGGLFASEPAPPFDSRQQPRVGHHVIGLFRHGCQPI